MLHKIEINSKGVATVTLDRPDLHNAFNAELIEELINVFLDLDKNKKVRLIILTGEGKSFCAGADINWMKKMKDYSLEENFSDSKKLCELFTTINSVSVPVIGRVNGHALGGGAGLIACCDYVIAVDTALIGFTEVKLGLVPAVISPFVIAKIGESYARATFLSGEKFNTEMALRMGLVHKTTTLADLDKSIESVVDGFLSAAPQATAVAKTLIQEVLKYKTIGEARDYTCETISKLRTSVEGQEGMSALLEKRKASWL